MSTKLDYYQTLEVTRNASGEEIKKSYRRLAMQCHPDKNPGCKASEEKFKYLSEAYEVLKDDQKRAAYDRYGHDAFKQGAGGGFGGGNPFNGFEFNFGGGGFSDIFENIFSEFMGGGGNRSQSRQSSAQNGNDLRYDLEISLEEAFFGLEKDIKFSALAVCDECHGHGTKNGKEAPTCPTCQGRGKVHTQRGFFMMESQCPKCRGKGRVVDDTCRKCHGQGSVNVERNLKVKLPAGIEDNTRVRVSGEGEGGLRGGRNGDLYVFVRIKKHKIYEREGSNLYIQIPVSFALASLGDSIEIPALDGSKVTIDIPEGSQTGQRIKVKKQGMSVYDSTSRGDLFVDLKVETPVKLTARQKEILREFAEISKENTHPESKGFWDTVKDLFKDAP